MKRIVLMVVMVGILLSGCGQATGTIVAVAPKTVDGAAMVFVPAGEFQMGAELMPDERPVHTVYLDAFWMDRYEVSNRLYQACVKAGACRQDPNLSDSGSPANEGLPATLVNWADADAYCKWAGKHLPTEAQWEKAARGTDGRTYPWGNTFDQNIVNSAYNLNLTTVPVDQFPDGASPYGAFNMAGNVWEWVADWYSETYYQQSPRQNPQGPASGELKVARGGGYGGTEAVMRTAQRRSIDGIETGRYLGFRCAE